MYKSFLSKYYINIIIHLFCAVIFYTLFSESSNSLFLFLLLNSILLLNINLGNVNKFLLNINLLNHFIFVISFFILYKYTMNSLPLYSIQIFIYTFIFFILKLSKYSKSINTWTYTHIFLVNTNFFDVTINIKIIVFCVNFIFLQLVFLILNFILKGEYKKNIDDDFILNYKTLISITWFNIKSINTQLALRGAITATFLFIAGVFLSNDHIRPTWTIIIAIGCLLSDDCVQCDRLIKNISVATILSLMASILLINLFFINKNMQLILSLISLVFSFYYLYLFNEQNKNKYLIINNSLIIICVVLFSKVAVLGFYEVFNLRLMSNILGIVTSITVLEIWKFIKKIP